MPITGSVTVKAAETWLPGVFEFVPYFSRITVCILTLRAVSTELVAEVHIEIETGSPDQAVCANPRHMDFPIEPIGCSMAVGISGLLLAHIIRLQRDDIGPLAPM